PGESGGPVTTAPGPVSCGGPASSYCRIAPLSHPQAAPTMRLTLLESDRSFLHTAEYAALSILAHAGLGWLIVSTAPGTFRLPTNEREARVLFLLPPDRPDAAERQADI